MAQQELKVRLSADAARFNRGMRSARGSFLNFKTAAVAGTAAVAAGLGKAIQRFAEFDQKMNESQAIMGDLSQTMRDDMAQAAREVGRTTLISANEAAESFFFLASAGLDAKQSIQALPQVAEFAQAGMFDMKQATDLLTDAQSALGLSMEDPMENMRQMTRLADVLVKANTLANASVQQFSEALTNRAAAAMRSANIELEEGVSILAAFADQGIKARRAGMFLSRMLRILRTSAAENREEFERLGLIDAEGNLASMADVVEILTQELGGMSDAAKAARLEQLGFTARIQDAILPLLGASKQIREYERGLRQAGGTTEEVAEKQLNTLSAQVDILTDKLGDMVLGLGEGTSEMLNLTGAVRGLNEALEEQAIRKFFAGAFPLILGQTREQIDRTRTLTDVIDQLASEVGPKMQDAFKKNAQAMFDSGASAREVIMALNRMAASMTTAANEANEFQDVARVTADGVSLLPPEIDAVAESADRATKSVMEMSDELKAAIGRGQEKMADDVVKAMRQLEDIDFSNLLSASLEVQEVLERWNIELSDLPPEVQEFIRMMLDAEEQSDNTKDSVEGIKNGLNAAVDGALQLMQAFGDVDSAVGRALGGVLQLGSAIEGFVDELQAAETSFAGIAGAVGAGLGAIGSIISEITRKTPAQKAAQNLQVSVELLSQNTEKLAQVVEQMGEVLTEKFITLGERFADLDLEASFVASGRAFQAIQDFRAELNRLGLSIVDVRKMARRMGVSVDELIKVLVTGEGDFAKAGQQLEFFVKAVNAVADAVGQANEVFQDIFDAIGEQFPDIGDEADETAEAMEELAQAFRDAREASSLMIEVFDIESISKRFQILIDDLAEAAGQLDPLFQQLRQADLSTKAGVERAEQLLRTIFEKGPEAFGLPEDVFRELVRALDRLIDQAREDLGETSGTITVGGGAEAGRPDFSQRSVITEVQAQEQNALLRSQLVQEEMQTEIQRQLIQVIADLPSNIRDGVDIALGEDQLVGGS